MNMLYVGIYVLLIVVHSEALIEFTLQPKSEAVVLGQTVILNCVAETDSPGTLVYTWYHNKNQQSLSVFSNHSLLIVDIQEGNLGNYSCHVTNTNTLESSVSTTAVLIQAFIKPFVTNPTSITVTEGKVATLDCLTGESAPPPEIRWEKDGQPVSTGTQYKASFGTHPDNIIGQYYMQLVLESKPKESGAYSCVAVNPVLGVNVRSVVVPVTILATESAPYSDLDVSQSSTVMSPQGFPLALNCRIAGFPKPVITWYKSQNMIVPDNRISVLSNGSLQMMVLTTGDQGYYFCEGKNYLGQFRTPEIFVQVAYIELQFLQEPDSLYVTAGKPVVLHCSPPISYPTANVTWYKNNQVINNRTGEHAVIISSTWDLFFTDIQKENEGRYFCVATNIFAVPTSRTSKSADLQIGGAPVFIDPPESLSVLKGQGAQMKCMVGGDPFPQITWLLDDLEVVPDSTLIIRNQNQEIYMTNVNKIREGLYTCKATNIYGRAESTAFLKVLVPPVIVDFTDKVTVTASMDLVMPCYVNGDPPPTIQWLKDSSELLPSNRTIINTASLVVKEVILEDAGIYTCHAYSTAGSVVSMATVIVNMKPVFLKSPINKTVTLGKSVTLNCEVKGYPLPVVTWLFNGTNLLPAGTVVSIDKSILSIGVMTWSHVGLYTCLASNTLGAVTSDGKLSVYVLPRILAINGDPVVYQGHDLELSCDVSGIPTPSVQWLYLESAVKPSFDGRVSMPVSQRLIIHYVRTSNAGEYKCVAENLSGKTELSTLVSVIEAPVPPVLVKAVSFTSTSVTLTWSPQTQKPNTLVSQFVIYFKTEIEADYKKFPVTAGSQETQKDVTDLSAGMVYMFMLSAVNPAGEGNQSNVISTKTMDSGPSAPRNLQALFSNSSTVTLSWEVPLQTNGQIRKYQVWFKIKGDKSDLMSVDTSKDVDKPSIVFSINNLDPFTLYEFKVRGATVEGGQDMWGVLSASVDMKTKATIPNGVAQITTVLTMSSRMVEIRWKEPASDTWNGANLQYRVWYTDLNFTSTIQQLITTQLAVNVSNLLPWRWYSFVLEVGNEIGWSTTKSVAVVTHTSPEAPVSPPLITSLAALQNQEVVVNFKFPDTTTWNSDLTGIIVQYSDNKSTQTNYIDDLQLTSVSIRQLLPWTEYKIRVAVYTDSVTNGDGPFSDWKTVRTSESAPGKVRNVNTEITPTSITLTWSPPLLPNGIIQYYIVWYQDIGIQKGYQTTASSSLIYTPTTDKSLSDRITRIETNLSIAVLTDLIPGHGYQITIMAVNRAGIGLGLDYIASTVSLPPQPPVEIMTTEKVMSTIITTVAELQSKGDKTILSPAVFGGVITGAVLVVLVVILVTCLCIRKRRQDQARYVNSKSPEVFETPGEDSLRTSKPKSELSDEKGSLRRIDFIGDTVLYGSNMNGQDVSSNKISTVDVPGLKLIHKSDGSAINGIENPGYDQDNNCDTESIAVSMTLSSEDLFSQSASSLKRTSRMRTESAAAIAVMRNQRLPRLAKSMDDTDTLINHDSVVIYTERTAL